MEALIPDAKRGLQFFAKSFVGETISELAVSENGVCVRMKSGLHMKIVRSYSTDIIQEKIIGYEFQFPENKNVLTLSLGSGRRVVILI